MPGAEGFKEVDTAKEQNDFVAMQPDTAADMIKDDEAKKLKNVLAEMEGGAN